MKLKMIGFVSLLALCWGNMSWGASTATVSAADRVIGSAIEADRDTGVSTEIEAVCVALIDEGHDKGDEGLSVGEIAERLAGVLRDTSVSTQVLLDASLKLCIYASSVNLDREYGADTPRSILEAPIKSRSAAFRLLALEGLQLSLTRADVDSSHKLNIAKGFFALREDDEALKIFQELLSFRGGAVLDVLPLAQDIEAFFNFYNWSVAGPAVQVKVLKKLQIYYSALQALSKEEDVVNSAVAGKERVEDLLDNIVASELARDRVAYWFNSIYNDMPDPLAGLGLGMFLH